jgi:hypothetical protein
MLHIQSYAKSTEKSKRHRVFSTKKAMMFSKTFLVALLVLSAITLCLAKPRWVLLHELDDQNLSDEVSTKDQNLGDEVSTKDQNLSDEVSKKDQNLGDEVSTKDQNLSDEVSTKDQNLGDEENWMKALMKGEKRGQRGCPHGNCIPG